MLGAMSDESKEFLSWLAAHPTLIKNINYMHTGHINLNKEFADLMRDCVQNSAKVYEIVYWKAKLTSKQT